MTPSPRGGAARKLSRWTALAVMAWLVGPAAVSVGASPDVAWPGPPCPDTVLLSVRGSSEAPQTDPTLAASYNADTGWGLGEVGALTVGQAQSKANGDDVTSQREGIVYQARPIPTSAGAWASYLDSIAAGGRGLVRQIKARIASGDECGFIPKMQIVGYSQGAWAVRIALGNLAAHDETAWMLHFVGGVTLFGDPSFDSDETIVRWNVPSQRRKGIGRLGVVRAEASDTWYRPYPRQLRSRVTSYCLSNDVVCRAPAHWFDLRSLSLSALEVKLNKNLGAHLSYGAEESVRGGNWLAGHLPPASLPAREFLGHVLAAMASGNGSTVAGLFADADSFTRLDEAVASAPARVRGCNMLVDQPDCELVLDAEPGVNWYALLGEADNEWGYVVTWASIAH